MPDDRQTLADILDDCRPSITASLVDEARYAQVRAQAARLPVHFSAFWGLEAPLGQADPAVDLLVEIRKDSGRHRLIAGDSPSSIDALCAQSPGWAALRGFAKAWAGRDDARAAMVRNAWVEFDLIAAAKAGRPLDAVLHPSVFWGPETDVRGDWNKITSLLAFLTEHFPAFPRALPLEPIAEGMRTLPELANVFQLGAMASRGDVMLRLCLINVYQGNLPAWLRAQGWPGDTAALARVLEALGPLVSLMAFDLDYTAAGLGPKLGIECYQSWPVLDTAQWQPLLDYASGLGLIAPPRRDAITAFPARTDADWKDQFEAGKKLGYVFPILYRNIHHVKLVFVGDRLTEAKAYLGVTRPGVKMEYPFPNIPAGEPDEWIATN